MTGKLSSRTARPLVGVLALVVVVAAQAGGDRKLTRPNTLVLVNAAKNAIVARIPLGVEPLRISFGRKRFWIVAPDARTVLSVDPRTHRIASMKLGKEPFDAAIGGGALWVPDHDDFRILRLDLRTHAVARSKDLGSPQLAIAYGAGAVWAVGADDSLRRLDPTTLAVTATIENVASSYEGYEPKIALARDGVWISDALSHAVARVDPEQLRVTYRRRLAGDGIAVGAGAVWSADGRSSVWRLGGGAAKRIHAGSGAIDVAAGERSVWVVNWRGRTLARIDASRSRVVRRFLLGREPVAVAVGGAYVGVVVR
jgi:streptogramin lyase